MYQWVREDIARAKLGLVLGAPLLGLLALEAFGPDGRPLLQGLVVAAIVAYLALGMKVVLVRRAFAKEDVSHG